MGDGHKHSSSVPIAAILSSAAAAFVQHAVQEQLIHMPWYHASNCKPLLATHIMSGPECKPDLITAARSFVHRLPCRLKCAITTISLTT